MSVMTALSARAFEAEDVCVRKLLARVTHLAAMERGILSQATRWTEVIRGQRGAQGIEAFLQTYGLDTREGVALMCLAEALLRIPDAATADQLIHATLGEKNWRAPIEGDEPWLVGASSWGLWLTGKVVSDPTSGITSTLHKLVGKLGEPVIRQALKQAMKLIGSQFVLAETMEDGIARAGEWRALGYRFSYDILGEGARSEGQALGYLQAYREAIALLGKHGAASLFEAPSLSVKLSALHPRYSLSQRERVMAELLPRVKEIMLLAKQQGLSVAIDAEEANRFDVSLMVFERLLADPDLAGWNGVGFVLQGYQKRALPVIELLREWAQKYGRVIPVRLVKGAYWDSEVKHAQVQGLPEYPVFTRKEHTDVSYLACADLLLKDSQYFYPQFATHNARTIASIQAMAAHHGVGRERFEFQRLHGMGEPLHDQVVGDYASRIYAPIGAHKDLLAYLIRRLLENGANTSFVNLLMDDDISVDVLLADPIVEASKGKARAIALPVDVYGDRKNSPGFDLGYLVMREELEGVLQKAVQRIAVPETSLKQLDTMVDAARVGFAAWSQMSVEKRAAVMEAVAERFERERDSLIQLLVREAKKTVPDAIGEWREAIDYCRYYAVQARGVMVPREMRGPTGEANEFRLQARGVFACISPWNFPLAIFVGQVVAALVTGNAVVAKPAEQTPQIAAFAVRLMHAAGVPEDVLQLAIGDGAVIGQALVADARIAGVVFTGSVEVAQQINRTLADRRGAIVPLIAETGGQNCMVVDSSALIEQAVDDIITSAFGSAGQRCSALRVLYVQEDIADELLVLLQGAMRELRIGDTAEIATDIGPVIDVEAQQKLKRHISELARRAPAVAVANGNVAAGEFVVPYVFEIENIEQLSEEHFGPVLHVIRFAADEMDDVVAAINGTGFGLTFGIHSRVEDRIQFFLERVHAGNCYVNRSMIGAVVGVQPFGGEGLSGTGPKAGGPHYLLRFVHERMRTVNSAAIGGNIALMTGK